MAESKLWMRWQYELVPPLGVLMVLPVYVLNYFMYGWAERWKYTDKVWQSLDVCYIIANIIGAYFIHTYGGYEWG